MSGIIDLIAELCPKGVLFEPLADIGKWYGGGTPSKGRIDYWQGGTIPWISPKDMSKTVIESAEDYITEAAVRESATKLVPANSVAVVVRSSILDRVLPTALVPMPVALNQDMKAVSLRSDILPRFVLHMFRSRGPAILRVARRTGGSVASIESNKLSSFRIPVPPLEVQREIVRVLDLYTDLEADLELNLEAELRARRRQYAFYRDSLLTPREAEAVRWTTLGEISTRVSSGGTPLTGRAEFYDGGTIPWLRTQEVRFVDIWSTDLCITDKAVKETSARWIPENCVIVAISGATAGRSAINKIPLTTNQHCCNFQIDPEQANYQYVFHWVSSRYEAIKAMGQGARSDLNAGLIKAFRIPIPPLDDQNRIVVILDKFDALVNDLSKRLPAELKARRKQYEYYRNRLLTFEELAS